MDHESLIEAAKEAIRAVCGDTSVSRRTTVESLRDLRDEIDVMIDAVETDLRTSDE